MQPESNATATSSNAGRNRRVIDIQVITRMGLLPGGAHTQRAKVQHGEEQTGVPITAEESQDLGLPGTIWRSTPSPPATEFDIALDVILVGVAARNKRIGLGWIEDCAQLTDRREPPVRVPVQLQIL